MVVRENGFGPVKSFFMTPAQMEEHARRVQGKQNGPTIKKWQRSMTKEQYLQAVREGRSRDDIVLKNFNNDPKELRKQLKEWGITEGEVVEMVQGKRKELEITKQEYLQRRLNGEKRSHIIQSLGVATPKVYELLASWGIRELDAEERELELMAPTKLKSDVDQRLAEQLEARGLVEFNAQRVTTGTIVQNQPSTLTADPAKQVRDVAELQPSADHWKADAGRKDLQIMELEKELASVRAELDSTRRESLKTLNELEAERQLLLHTIEHAAAAEESNSVAIRIPILSVAIANVERARIYAAVEALSTDVEAADIDRERVMTELFDLLQRTINFITADLAELHPGKPVIDFVQEFFHYYNARHIEGLTLQQQAS
ncbi:hypothetical protein D3P09_02420 [Paenibacillus pinisoli]|uniref:Uncharacterized protein n=1 Tax=Paenibacillus pinisoli TaxID=1276110 RepID=A0A3A6PMC9_9BACL|nr:hypothetical protein [Paenibacillus pinisoli]RJX40896.1 hypothetical protein D3P09_02420 [Paenibacillus pinisoli]